MNSTNGLEQNPTAFSLSKVADRLRHSRFLTPWFLSLFFAAIVGTLSYLYWRVERLQAELPLQGSELTTMMVSEMRRLYSDEVVAGVAHADVAVSHQPAKDGKSIPLPATLTMSLGEKLRKIRPGVDLRLFSEYPFPYRKNGGPQDEFERKALVALQANPGEPFYRFEDYRGRASLRFAVADRMESSCVSCHNSHPDSPKKDWKVGDVRGVLEFIRPFDQAVAAEQAALFRAVMATLLMLGIGLGVLSLTLFHNSQLAQKFSDQTAKLLAIEERFELAVSGSSDGLWDWNVLTNEVYFAPRMKELMGYQDNELANVFETFETRLHPDDHDWVMRAVDEHLTHRKPYDVEYRLLTKSGKFRWFRARGQAIWNEEGKATRMAGSVSDVTEQRQLRERFQLAVEASPAALLMVRHDGTISMANSRALALFGYGESELVGQLIEVLVPARFREGHPHKRDGFFQSPTSREMGAELELLGVRKDGSEFPVKVGLSPVQIENDPVVICGVLDISAQKQAMKAMQQAKEAAESSSRAKSSFLANMSHEIRTPMNGIIGMAQLLARTPLKPNQRDYLSTVEESAHVLLRLLNDILDFSKIEAGKLELETVDFRLAECVTRASQMLVLRAAEKGLEIACRIAPDIPSHLRGDPGRLQQVLVNLLGNAVKFTEAGEIYVNVNLESSVNDFVHLHFTVSDTGIGIPSAKQEEIFRPFEQAEASTTRRFGGTGLGLTISRQLVELMHGRLWVESEPGRGSTFHFTVAFQLSAEQFNPEPAELNELTDLPVLVVDDNFTNRRILGEMLSYWHMQPVLVDSAAAARAALKKAGEAKRPIRLILLDHHMPGEDGFHFAESVHNLPLVEECPIIMISSGSAPLESDLCEKVGIRRFMTKPVIASELLNEVLRQLGKDCATASNLSATTASSPRVPPRRVLLVEDNEINRRVAVGFLDARGHQVVMAENGQEAVDILSEQEFDVVLMDMQMPVMDGYEATAAIRQRERQTGGHIPIVAMTAEALKGDRERCLSVGMDDYVSKPIAPAEMYRAIERFPALCLASVPVASAASQTESIPLPSPVDEAYMATQIPGGEEGIRELAAIFCQEAPQLLANMHSAIEARDAKVLRRASHTLKSSSAYFGATLLSQASLALEEYAREENFENAQSALATLENEMSRVLAALEARSGNS